MKYQDYIEEKLSYTPPSGMDVAHGYDGLFPHQDDLIKWALRRGRCAVFADTGLGKSRIQVAWADTIHRTLGLDCLILCPLAVAPQTVEEGRSLGVTITHCLDDVDVRPGINIANYERLHRFDPSRFGAVVLDESSCIKHHETKTLKALIDAFSETPYRLCATATPAPNDWTELGTHAEFLGIRSRVEMLSEFFVHDGAETQVWRLKGHAKQIFWQWVSSWGAMIRKPSDLGHDDSAYALPPLSIVQHVVQSPEISAGRLFAMEAQTLMERRDARRESVGQRVKACADIVNADAQAWVVWCDLNAEGEALRHAIPGSVEIRGSDSLEEKEKRLGDFAAGRVRVLITKPSIAGFGLNWQHCARMAFVGVTDSFEAYYQAVRRCWRFGQKRPVEVNIFASEREGSVIANLQRKERDAAEMADELSKETLSAMQLNVLGSSRESNLYVPEVRMVMPSFMEATCTA